MDREDIHKGLRVRGADNWRWGNQDQDNQGKRAAGTVLAIDDNCDCPVHVAWDTGHHNYYYYDDLVPDIVCHAINKCAKKMCFYYNSNKDIKSICADDCFSEYERRGTE